MLLLSGIVFGSKFLLVCLNWQLKFLGVLARWLLPLHIPWPGMGGLVAGTSWCTTFENCK